MANLDTKRARQILEHLEETGQGFCYVPAMSGSAIAGLVSVEDIRKLLIIA